MSAVYFIAYPTASYCGDFSAALRLDNDYFVVFFSDVKFDYFTVAARCGLERIAVATDGIVYTFSVQRYISGKDIRISDGVGQPFVEVPTHENIASVLVSFGRHLLFFVQSV